MDSKNIILKDIKSSCVRGSSTVYLYRILHDQACPPKNQRLQVWFKGSIQHDRLIAIDRFSQRDKSDSTIVIIYNTVLTLRCLCKRKYRYL